MKINKLLVGCLLLSSFMTINQTHAFPNIGLGRGMDSMMPGSKAMKQQVEENQNKLSKTKDQLEKIQKNTTDIDSAKDNLSNSITKGKPPLPIPQEGVVEGGKDLLNKNIPASPYSGHTGFVK